MARCWSACVVGAVLAGLTGPAGRAQDKPKGPFEGKVIVVWLHSDRQAAPVLEGAEARRLGERDYLRGKVVNSVGDTGLPTGATVWLALEDVARIVEFDNLREAGKVYRLQP